MIPANVDSVQEPRLSKHNEVILDMLRKGPVTNVEIAKVSKNHTERISNLRGAGYDIRCEFIDRETGLTRYTLHGRSEPKAKPIAHKEIVIQHHRGNQVMNEFTVNAVLVGGTMILPLPTTIVCHEGDLLSTKAA